MTDLPEPLVPANCDLRDFPFMAIDIRRLLTSETWLTCSAEAKCAALTLWLESFHQVPAASLPDNDRMLAVLSQAGGRWRKLKGDALRGWVKCSDGRLYHPVVADKALEAWGRKRVNRLRGKAGAEARWGLGQHASSNAPTMLDASHEHASSNAHEMLADSKREGQGQGQGQGQGSDGLTTIGQPPAGGRQIVEVLFSECLAYLTSQAIPKERARSMIGKWRKEYGDGEVSAAIGAAQKASASNPLEYIPAVLQRRQRSLQVNTGPPQPRSQVDDWYNPDGSLKH